MATPFITDAEATQKIQQSYSQLESQIDGVASGYRGAISIADTPTEDGIYTPIETGVYPNAGGLEYDSTEGMTYFIRTQGVWIKNVIPIGLTATGVVEEGNTQAVSGGEVYEKTVLKSDVNIVGNVFNINNIIYDKYIGGSGSETESEGTSFGFVDLDDEESHISLFIPDSGGNGRRHVFVDGNDDIIEVVNTGLNENITHLIPQGSKLLKFTIDAPQKDQVVDKNLIRANYGTSLLPENQNIDSISGRGLEASSIKVTENTISFIEDNSNLIKESYIYNLVDPNEVHPNSTWNNGVYTNSEEYHATGLIEIEDLQPLFAIGSNGNTAPVRAWRELDANGTQIQNHTDGDYGIITPQDDRTKYLILIFWNTVPYNGLCISKTNEGYKPYEGIKTSYILKEQQTLNNPKSVVTKENLNVIKESYIYNLVDPNEVHPNSTWSNGEYINSEAYHATGLIEIEDLQPLFAIGSNGNTTPVRSWRELDVNGEQIHNQTGGDYGIITPQDNRTKYLILIFQNTVPYNGLCISKTNEGYKPYEGIKDSYILKEQQTLNNPKSVVTKENLNVIKESYIYNLVDPNEVHQNSTWSSGEYVESSAYHATGLIEIEDLQPLFAIGSNGNTAPVRAWRELDVNGEQIHNQTGGDYGIITPQDDRTKYLILIFWNTVPYNGLCISKTNEGYKPYEGIKTSYILKEQQTLNNPKSVVTKENLEDVIANSPVNNNVRLNLSNSDKILYTGSSSIESFYAPDYKAWVNKLQDFLDWQIVPYGWSGQGANSIATKFQLDTPTQVANGVKPSEINPTYVFIGQTLNSNDLINNEFDTAFIESNENLLRSAVAITGAKPIIGTAYRTERRPWIENSLKNLADKWEADFIPIGTYHRSMIRTDKYEGFYGSGHPSIRTHEAYTLPLLSYFSQLERPKQGILLFEARDQNADVLDLGYKESFMRAEKFRSIQVGEMALNTEDQDMYDRLDESGTYDIRKNNTSEYMKLLKKQEVVLSDKVLIEFILPKVRTSEVTLVLDADNINNYYLFNTFSQQFESASSLTVNDRKYIEFDKIKLLCVGESITLRDVYADIVGGVDKPKQADERIMPVTAGKTIIESQGFDSTTVLDWDIGTNQRYNITTYFGDDKFNDMPAYLGESKDLIVLTDVVKRTFTLSNEDTFGYRKLRVWTCARMNPPIYNPGEHANWVGQNNPYTDVSWYGQNKYDYDDLNIIVKYNGVSYHNQCKSINIQKVGLFWNLGYVDVILPVTRDGSYELQIYRGSNNNEYPMELCDVSVEII